MDIKSALLEEHSKKQCEKIVSYIGNNKTRFAELMKLFFQGEYRVTQRAAWPMSNCVSLHPSLITPYINRLLKKLDEPKQHEAVARNIVRLLQEIDIPKKYHGKIMTLCFDFIQSNDAAVAIKAHSLTILDRLSKIYPEIRQEVKTIIEERWEHETAAFHSRARRFMKV